MGNDWLNQTSAPMDTLQQDTTPGAAGTAPAPIPGQPSPAQGMMNRAETQVGNPPDQLPAPHPQQPMRINSASGLLGAIIMGVTNARAAHKESQIKDSEALYTNIQDAHQRAQRNAEIMGKGGDKATIDQLFLKDPFIQQNLVGDTPVAKKNVKQMKDILKIDIMDPESSNTTHAQGLGRVIQRGKAENMMNIIKSVLNAHNQHSQGQGQPPTADAQAQQPLPGALGGGQPQQPAPPPTAAAERLLSQARPGQIDTKQATELANASANMTRSLNGEIRASVAEGTLNEKSDEFKQTLALNNRKLDEASAKVDKELKSKQELADLKSQTELQISKDRLGLAKANQSLSRERLDFQKAKADGSLPTTDIVTRGQLSKQTLDKIEESKIYQQINEANAAGLVGPLSGTVSDLIYGKGGFADAKYIKMRSDLKLIGSAVGRAHLGGRVGSPAALKYFVDMYGGVNASADNIKAALDSQRDTLQEYAAEVPNFQTHPGGSESATGKSSSNSRVIRYDAQGNRIQ